jgi:hypothetical protein
MASDRERRLTAGISLTPDLLAVLEDIGQFDGRSSLKTWICSGLTNRPKTRATATARTFNAVAAPQPGLPHIRCRSARSEVSVSDRGMISV